MSGVSLAGLEPVFRVFTRLLGIPVVPVDEAGVPMPGWDPLLPLCGLIQSVEAGKSRCLSGCHREAAKARKPGLFHCHAGLVGFVFPVRVATGGLFAVAGCPVVLRTPEPSRWIALAQELGLAPEPIIEAACSLPVSTPEEVLGKGRGLAILAESQAASAVAAKASREIAEGALNLFSSLEGIGAAGAFPDLAAYLTDVIAMVFSVDRVALVRPNAEGIFRCGTVTGEDQEKCSNLLIDPRCEPFAEGLASGRPFVVTSHRRLLDAGFPEDVRMLTAVPVGHGGEVRGVILLLDARLTPARVRLLSAFTGMVGMALANQELRGLSATRVERLRRLTEIARRAGADTPDAPLIEPLLQRLTEALEADRASVMTFDKDPETLTVRLRKSTSPAVMTFTVPSEGCVVHPVLTTGEPMLVRGRGVGGEKPLSRRRYRTGSFVSTPLVIGGRVRGAVSVADRADGGHFDDIDLALLLVVSHQVASAMEREGWKHRSRRLTKLTMTDPLTGLLNRRFFSRRLDEELERCRRMEKPIAFLMVDIDHFKHYNDRNGHPAGDGALRQVAAAIKAAIRTIDLAARYGGEEFAIILPFTGSEEAAAVAERLRKAVEESPVPHGDGQPAGRLTVSVGVRTGNGCPTTAGDLVAEADQALYRAKREGRNRVVVHT
jgi:diguanylate cyclase (GGDEF)-like protein